MGDQLFEGLCFLVVLSLLWSTGLVAWAIIFWLIGG